jgi:molybdenum cofactor synthesis domain-containing protein
LTTDLEIICIGNELLIGKVLNTNAQWLAKRSNSLGINVRRTTVVPDNLDEIGSVIREALLRKPAFIITTGGLGPTFDDMTLLGIANALKLKLEVNPIALEMVRKKYETFAQEKSAELTQPRTKMATIPEGATPIRNPVGTAPGIELKLEETNIFALPGVPSEMEAIFEQTIMPILKKASGGMSFHEYSIFADNIMESNLAPLIDKVMHDNPLVYIKSHPKGRENIPHMELHISTSAENTIEADAILQKAASELSDLIARNRGKIVNANTKPQR